MEPEDPIPSNPKFHHVENLLSLRNSYRKMGMTASADSCNGAIERALVDIVADSLLDVKLNTGEKMGDVIRAELNPKLDNPILTDVMIKFMISMGIIEAMKQQRKQVL